jgi:hypothetical protein
MSVGGGAGGGCVWEGHVHVCMEAPEPLVLLASCYLALGKLCTVQWCAVLCCAAPQRAPLRCNAILWLFRQWLLRQWLSRQWLLSTTVYSVVLLSVA